MPIVAIMHSFEKFLARLAVTNFSIQTAIVPLKLHK